MTKNIAIIGCGAIGSQLAHYLNDGKILGFRLVALYDEEDEKLNLLEKNLKNKHIGLYADFDKFITSKEFRDTHLLIESASIAAAKAYTNSILNHDKDMMIMSIGAFSDPDFYETTTEIMKKKGNRVYLPTGAIGGSDILRTIRDFITDITLITTKPAKSLKGAPFFQEREINVESFKEKTIVFEGDALEAIKQFPSNVNVSALVSLAGVGFKKTKVMVCIDPSYERNQHEIVVKWKFGEFLIRVKNDPSPDNPKTSYLAILSAIECLRSISDKGFKIGS
ncbi:MAG: aspartate dehydrogenase [Candidatus Nitrosocosmicus sp.]